MNSHPQHSKLVVPSESSSFRCLVSLSPALWQLFTLKTAVDDILGPSCDRQPGMGRRLTPQAHSGNSHCGGSKKAAPVDYIHTNLLARACIRSGFTINKYSSDIH